MVYCVKTRQYSQRSEENSSQEGRCIVTMGETKLISVIRRLMGPAEKTAGPEKGVESSVDGHDQSGKEPPLAPPQPQRRAKVSPFVLHPEVPNADRHEYHITDDAIGTGTPGERFNNNVRAIRLLKRLEAEDRLATPEEQEVLARYVGWGGLADCFDERHSKYAELKALLTEDEYAAARESTLTAFYTPPVVIRSIYQALTSMGFQTGNILEPSCGIGNFIGMRPEALADSKLYGVELDSISGRIAQQLYQQSSIAVQGFEKTDLPDSFFDAAIGNVPFGSFKVIDKRYDRYNFLIHDYFFARTLDKVRPGGIIAFVTSKGTMDMFIKRTIKQRITITHVDTASEALAVSLAEKAKVDMDYMAELTGKTEQEVYADLTGVIFLNPMHGYGGGSEEKYLTADEYLSGNVREKLEWAKRSAELYPEDYTAHVQALERVQPVDLTASEIAVRLGATWLPTEVIDQFIYELFGASPRSQRMIRSHYSQHTGAWNIESKFADRGNVKAENTYGTTRVNGYKIIEETLNLRDLRIFDYVEDEHGNRVPILNKKETAIAQGKQQLIKQAFQDWIWKDPARRERLTRLYNDKFNSIRPREYDGSHLKFVGINPEITLRPHQVNAIAHILYGGNTLLAHVVGAGKTLAYIHSANTETQKKELFGKVRSGQVRVLIGSTQKMGAGTNVQKKLVALHHLDCPWRPSDLQQREGRIIRQGNENNEVDIYTYVTENTFDSYLYQLVEGKQKFIGQIMTSKSPVRACEDIDETALSYAEIKALCTGNPHIKEKMDLDIDVQRLRLLKANHLSQRYALEDQIIKELPQQIAKYEQYIEGYLSDMDRLKENTHPNEDGFSPMEVEGTVYTDKKAAGSAILAACKAMTSPEPVPLGQYRGFSMDLSFASLTREFKVTLKGALYYTTNLGTDVFGNILRLDNLLESMEERINTCREQLENTRMQLENAKLEVDKPFPQEDELKRKSARLDELNILLNMDKRESEIVDGDVGDEVTAPARGSPDRER